MKNLAKPPHSISPPISTTQPDIMGPTIGQNDPKWTAREYGHASVSSAHMFTSKFLCETKP